jgi:putative hemolysin
MLTALSLLLLLILVNGLFALSEIAIISSKRARLLQLADEGKAGAEHALRLASEPTRFLSTVQVGITSIGILSGAIGQAAVAGPLQAALEQTPAVAAYAEPLSIGVMVVLVTYVSLILGELVPKRLALTRPESIASLIARPMRVIARLGRPVVYVLSLSTDTVLRLLRVRQTDPPSVTVEEIKVMLEQGAEEGVFEQTEHEMVTNVLNLDDRHVGSVLTPRVDVVFLDVRDSPDVNRDRVRQAPHAVLPLCDGGLDQVLGFVRSARAMDHLHGGAGDLAGLAEPALVVPETMTLMKLLEQFKRTHLPVALVIDEFGDVEGLVSLTDVISSIVGELPTEAGEEPMIVRREDGSWLMDGGLSIDAVLQALDTDSLLGEDDRHYHTLGGLVMQALGRVPKTGDVFTRAGFRFEVVDMDANRVDRVMVGRMKTSEPRGRQSS